MNALGALVQDEVGPLGLVHEVVDVPRLGWHWPLTTGVDGSGQIEPKGSEDRRCSLREEIRHLMQSFCEQARRFDLRLLILTVVS